MPTYVLWEMPWHPPLQLYAFFEVVSSDAKHRNSFDTMSHLLQIVVRILALVSGIACIYVALFLYEDEQGKVQSILEGFWIRLSDFGQTPARIEELRFQ